MLFKTGIELKNRIMLVVQGKVVFVAPTRPLVTQQIEACRRSVGMPQVRLC